MGERADASDRAATGCGERDADHPTGHDPDAPWRRDGRVDEPKTVRSGESDTVADHSEPKARVALASGEIAEWSRAAQQGATRSTQLGAPTGEPTSAAGGVRSRGGAEGSSPPHLVVPTHGADDRRPSSAGDRELVFAGLVVVAIATAAVAAALALRPPGGRAAPTGAPVIAESAEVAWTRTFPGAIDDVGVGAREVVVATVGTIVALDADSGRPRWRVPVVEPGTTVERVAVVGDQVVVVERPPTGAPSARVLARDDGRDLWAAGDRDGRVFVAGSDDDPLLVRRVQNGGDAVLWVLDPATGDELGEPLRLSGVQAAQDAIAIAPSDRTVAVWSPSEREQVTAPVPSFNLRMIAPADGGAVALDREGRVILFDDDGRRVDERPFADGISGEVAGRAVLAGVVDGDGDADVALVSSDRSVAFALRDGSIEAAWQRIGGVGAPVVTAVGPMALLVGPVDDTGALRESIVDATDGSTVAVTDRDGRRERSAVLGHDAYVLAPTIGAPDRTLTARSYGGDVRWRLDLPAGAGYELAHGTLVVVESEPSESRVSLAR